jgi:hypothetical protein
MDSKLTTLYESVTMAVIQRFNSRSRFNAILKACRSSMFNPHDMLDYWKKHTPGFAEFLDSYLPTKFSTAYCQKWSLKSFQSFTDDDIIRVCDLYHYRHFSEDYSDFVQHDNKFMSMVMLAIFCHENKKVHLPRCPVSDSYCLWPVFRQAFPEAAEAFVAEAESAIASKRKLVSKPAPKPKRKKGGDSEESKMDKLIGTTESILELVQNMCVDRMKDVPDDECMDETMCT